MTDRPDFYDITLITGRDSSGNLVTVAVDSSGNIIGVMKGDYAGALKTIAVDSQGRLLAILTDPEDVFGHVHYLGLAELAARLGSIVTFDRRGEVAFLDSFEDGFSKWWWTYYGAGASVVISSDCARSGALSAKLTTGTTLNDHVRIRHAVHLPILTRKGFEISFTVSAEHKQIELWHHLIAAVRYDHNLATLSYLDSSFNWQVFATLALPLETWAEHYLHTAKLVIDQITHKYVRFLLDGTEYNLGDYSLYGTSSSIVGFLIRTNGDAAISYVDDAIITLNEP